MSGLQTGLRPEGEQGPIRGNMALDPADISVVSRLLDQALALPAAEREAWLAALPDEYRRHAEALWEMLAQEEQLGTDPLLASMPSLAEEEAVAHTYERVGPYRLLREIGRGGMGSVWLAERAEGTFQRQVALKLPRVAWTEGLGARMAREQRIAAMLEHPNIARLYDAGVDERNRPYIAMEYIEGKPIGVYCEEHDLGTRARLTLYLQVVRAVAYAHGRLVVHRDLKPANVVVDAQGNAHLLDFGIAKLLDDTAQDANLTQEQGRALTPSYAAPEQLAGQPVSVATDIYALGVMLYELLTGQLPYQPRRKTAAAMEEAILAGDAPPASSRVAEKAKARALRGEVDAILGKAMRREPQQRYATADALAIDIERHLAGDTVSARPDSLAYRTRKALRRHWVGFGATAAILLALAVGGAATWWQASEAAREAQRTRLATQFVSEMFRTNVRLGLRERTGAGENADTDPNAKLIATRFAGQPDVQAELYGAVGRVYADIGASKLAAEFADRQLTALEIAQGPPEFRVRALLLLADANVRGEHYLDAEKALRQAVRLSNADSSLGFEARVVLAEALYNVPGKWPEADGLVQELMKSRWASPNLPTMGGARLLRLRAKKDKGRTLDDASIRMAIELEGPTSYWANRMRLELASGELYTDERGAFALYEEAVQALTSSGDVGRIQAATLSANFWRRAGTSGRRTAAEALRGLEACRATLLEFGSAVPAEAVADVELEIGLMNALTGRAADAYRQIPHALATLLQSRDQFAVRRRYIFDLAIAEGVTGHHRQADAHLREQLQLLEASGDGKSLRAANVWELVSQNLIMEGRVEEAERVLGDAPVFDDPASRRLIATGIAWARLSQGDPTTALKMLPELPSPFSPNSAEAWLRGEILCETGQAATGLPLLVGWLEHAERRVAADAAALARTRSNAALCALQLGDRQRAEAWAHQARLGLAAQPEVSDWFKEPLRRLEKKLKALPPSSAR